MEFQDKTKKLLRSILEALESGVIAFALCIFIYLFVAIPNQVQGDSMLPTFYNNDLLLTNKVLQWLGRTSLGDKLNANYERGDVIVFEKNDSDLIKRIIGLPGDTIKIENSELFVNGKRLDEKYLPITTQTFAGPDSIALIREGQEITVPENSYFVMGDNREESNDSRYLAVGFVPRKYIKGKVFFRYWPLNRFGIIRQGDIKFID